jgi:hypothetical protein
MAEIQLLIASDKLCGISLRKGSLKILLRVMVRVILFNATFNNISVISLRSVLLVEETGVTGENH